MWLWRRSPSDDRSTFQSSDDLVSMLSAFDHFIPLTHYFSLDCSRNVHFSLSSHDQLQYTDHSIYVTLLYIRWLCNMPPLFLS